MEFDYSLNYDEIDFRAQPSLYQIGKGEQGVLLIEPYKSEILPHWRFKTPEIAQASVNSIYALFLGYKAQQDFVGMDMARKFIQMGYTRARRYANHKSGRKWSRDKSELLPFDEDPEKAEAAHIFRLQLDKIKADAEYQRLTQQHRDVYDPPKPSGKSVRLADKKLT